MRRLNFELKQLCARHPARAFGTQAERQHVLAGIADDLHALGYRNMMVKSLADRHVRALVAHWDSQGLSIGTMKNRMAALRWWAERIDKPATIARANSAYDIPERVYVSDVSKAWNLSETALAAIDDPYTRCALRLESEFGLRREESIKIQPAWADRGDTLLLKASWCKGGRERAIPIRTESQRGALEEAKRLAADTPRGSLIACATYREQLGRFIYACRRAHLDPVHGLRHAYAQRRYAEEAGRACPAAGGPKVKTLTPQERTKDRDVRQKISSELGHGREAIVAVYCGR